MVNNIKSAIGICARHEHKYIQECICFNYLQGWDKIIIAMHQMPGETGHDHTIDMIRKLPGEVLEKVTIITIEHDPCWGYQHKGYHYIAESAADCEWLGMFDVDEYLYDSQHRSISELLAAVPEDAGQVIVPWVEFGHNNQVTSVTPQETRLAAFTKRMPLNPRANFKSIVRVKNIYQQPNQPHHSHNWYYCHMARVSGRHVYFNGQDAVPKNFSFEGDHWQLFWDAKTDFTDFDPCLVHYFTGSMEDWVIRRRRPSYDPKWQRDVNLFISYTCETEDTRMSIYIDELRALLEKAAP